VAEIVRVKVEEILIKMEPMEGYLWILSGHCVAVQWIESHVQSMERSVCVWQLNLIYSTDLCM
jgi:hypothetical protein